MKKGEIYEGTVTEVAFGNKCVVKIDGEDMPVYVKNALPGQKVRLRLTKKRNGHGEGMLLETLAKAKNELECPACIHFGKCGGCQYQNISYEYQIALKTEQIKKLLEPVVAPYNGDFSCYEGVTPSPIVEGYRNKMEFSFGDEVKDGPMTLGLHRRASTYDIITVGECQIVDEDFRKILVATLECTKAHCMTYLHKRDNRGYYRHLLVRKAKATGEILVDLVTTTQVCSEEKSILQGFLDALLALELDGTLVGVLHTKNDSLADAVIDQGTEVLYGRDYFYEEILGLKFKITPFSFFQTNSLGAEVLYDTARQFIGDISEGGKFKPTVFDLYSGTGTIAQIMAPVCGKVIGVEIVEEAVEAAKINAGLNGLDNCEFIAGDVLKKLDEIEDKPDFIILDPPREGCNPKALRKIIDYGVDRMVYISCKPTSLARDLEMLQEAGYRVERVRCVDMFPSTGHCETIALLSK